MNPAMLPHRVKAELDKIQAGEPLAALRTSGALDGEPGEGYIIALSDRFVLISRKAGEDAYATTVARYDSDVRSAILREEKFNTFLDIELASGRVSYKFSAFEKKNVAALVNVSASGGKPRAASAPPPPKVDDTSTRQLEPVKAAPVPRSNDGPHPYVGLLAALMCIAKIDKEVAPEEDGFVRKVAGGDVELLKAALDFQKRHPVDELVSKLSGSMDDEQKLCVIANMLEAAMLDGSYRGNEQRMIRLFVERLGVPEDHFEAIRQVLMIKNNLTVMTKE